MHKTACSNLQLLAAGCVNEIDNSIVSSPPVLKTAKNFIKKECLTMNSKLLIPLFIIMAMLFGACGVNVDLNIDRGSGNITTETRTVSNFDRVILTGIGDLVLIQGDSEGLEIEAEDNVISRITSEVKNGTLEIGFDTRTVIPTKSVKFRLTMRNIRGIESKGVSNINANDFTTDQLDIGISGTGNITMRDITAEQVTVNVSGAGSLTLDGKADQQKITMSGAGNFNGEDLESGTSDITITGLGRATVWVTEALDVTISGTGGVDYYGSPSVSQQISGLGRLKDMGNK